MKKIRRAYWKLRAMMRYGVLNRAPNRNQTILLAQLRVFPRERECLVCGGKFWAFRDAEVCVSPECYMAHKMGVKP